MNVLVTGATGFTGDFVVRQLTEAGFHVTAFVRKTSDLRRLPAAADTITGDLNDQRSLRHALVGRDALVCIASLGFGHADGIVSATKSAGVSRAVFISTTAIFTTLNASSRSVRMAAEHTIQSSGLDYTILRPTMIYGTSRDRNMCRLIRFVDRRSIIPILGSGQFLQQPVYVNDVAKAVAQTLTACCTVRKCYNIPGATAHTYDEVIDIVAELLGRSVRKVHLPAGLVMAGLNIAEKCRIRLPIKAEQVARLNEDKSFNKSEATEGFGYNPISFREGIARELEDMRLRSASCHRVQEDSLMSGCSRSNAA